MPNPLNVAAVIVKMLFFLLFLFLLQNGVYVYIYIYIQVVSSIQMREQNLYI